MNNINGEVSCVNLCETKKIIFYQRVIIGLLIQNLSKSFGASTKTDYNL